MRINNIYTDKKDIYVFYRDDFCNLKITKLTGFFPYYYEKDPSGNFKSFKGETLKKLFVSNPSDIAKKRTNNAYEADLLLSKRFLIDKVEVIDKAPIKYCFIDIEILASEMPNTQNAIHPISCISIYNSLSKSIQTFYLPDYESEYKMIESFIKYMQKEKFDIWFSWNVKFDYNYLANRFPDFVEKISPINKTRYGDGEVYYPAGTSIIDYLMWFKKITLGRQKMYTLDYIAQKFLGDSPKQKINFHVLSPELKQHNIEDVQKLFKLEEKMQLVEYYDEIRRLTKNEWEDFEYNSRAIDMLLLQEAKNQNIVLPMRPTGEGEEEEFEGAFRSIYEVGRMENIGKADISSAYPYAIIDFCLDPANITIVPDGMATVDYLNKDNLMINGTIFKQNSNALVPTIVKKLITLKTDIKKELNNISIDNPKYKNIKIKYEAIKSLVNSAYGTLALKFFRLFDIRVAGATTFIVRSLLHYIKDKLDGSGHQVVYIDTDGIFYKNPTEEMNDKLNEWVQMWAKETFDKDNTQIIFENEGTYESLLLLAKCRYVGRLRHKNGELEIETKGIEAKRKDSTKYMGQFQTTLINKILDNEKKESIYTWIKEEIKNFNNQKLIDISFPCKMAKQKSEYKSIPIFSRALDATPEFKARIGDSFYYIYMDGEDENKKDMVKAFDEDNYEHIKREEVNWQRMLERNIVMKLEVIFEAMKWNITDIYIAPPTHKICDKCLKEKTLCRFPETGNTCKRCIKEGEKPKKVKKVSKDTILPLNSSISEPLMNDNAEIEGHAIPEMTLKQESNTQPIDNKEVKCDKNTDNFAREVSKQTCPDSIRESSVKVANLAPILDKEKQEDKRKELIESKFDKIEWKVKEINRTLTYEWILYKHYAHRLKGLVICHAFGLYWKSELVGIITYGSIPNYREYRFWQPINLLELNRLVVNDGLPKNSLSYFVSQSLNMLPTPSVIISFSDYRQGHYGYIYQATNWKYTGDTIAGQRIYIMKDGTERHQRHEKEIELSKVQRIEKTIGKSRYYYLCGTKKEKKELLNKLIRRHPILPYPKGNNQNYDASYKIKNLNLNRNGIEQIANKKDLVISTSIVKNNNISQCSTCFCMTHTIKGYCGKCKAKKETSVKKQRGRPRKDKI